MIKNSTKTNLLLEDFTTGGDFDLDLAYPSEEDFVFVKKAKAEYAAKNYNAEAQYRPDVLAVAMTNKNRIIRVLVASILLGWNDMTQAMKAAFEKLGGSNNELKSIINEIIANRSKISGFDSEEKEEEPQQTQSQQATNTTGQSANAGITNMGVNKNFCRLIIYDVGYNPPARRHLYVSKKVGNTYNITVGGSQLAPSHTWYDEPLFDSLQQAENFINNVNQTNIKTVVDTRNFKYNITDKPIDLGTYQGNKHQIADLSDAVLVNTVCGPAYIQRKNKKCVESLQEKIVRLSNGDWQVQSEKGRNMGTYDTKKEAEKRLGQVEYFKHMNEEVKEDVEKHKHLNPKLFDNNHLKPEVRQKCMEIVDFFLKQLEEDEVKIDVKDIIFTGSNASYNYTKDSDIDLHIIADTSNFECPDNLYPKLYNAYKSLFNSKFDVSFYGIPVEIYVEADDTPLISNGVYSIKNDVWEQEPTETTIPEIDWNEFMKVYQPWEDKYRELIRNTDPETATDDKPIDDFITKVYELRHQGLANEGQYGFSNLIFKELRNRGHLQELKDLKNEIIENRLTLEALTEAANIDEKTRLIYRNKLAQIAHNQPIIQTNGLFNIYNVKADDADYIIRELYRQGLVEFASKSADKFDFSKINFNGMPSRYYTISGKIKL